MTPASRERLLWGGGFALLVVLIAGAMTLARALGYQPMRGSPSPLVGHAAPDLDLPVVGAAGERVSLVGLRGEVVVLDFWASWCNPCRHSIPALNEVHERYQDRVQMYGVNVDRGLSQDGIQEAHRSFGAEFPSLADDRGGAQMDYQVSSIPTIVLIDRGGTVRFVFHGVPDPDDVSDALGELLTRS